MCSPFVRHALLVGGEMRSIEGTRRDPYSAQGLPLVTTQTRGTQRLGSGFAQATFNVNGRLTVVAATGKWLAHRPQHGLQ